MALRDLLEQRSQTVAAMRAITDQPAGDGGDLSDEQAETFDRHKGALERIERSIGRQQTVDDAERRMAAPAIIKGNGRDGAYEERARQFSIVKAINAALGEPVDNGFEREISAEVRARAGRPFMGIAVPDEGSWRSASSPSAPRAADLYPTMHRDDLFIDRLRSALVVARAGATILDGLVGDQEIPRQLTSSTAQHVAEDGPLISDRPDLRRRDADPEDGWSVDGLFSRRTLINARPSIEQLVRNDLAAVIAPRLIFRRCSAPARATHRKVSRTRTTTSAATLATPAWGDVVGLVATIETADADVGALAWVMSPKAVAKLRTIAKVSSTATV